MQLSGTPPALFPQPLLELHPRRPVGKRQPEPYQKVVFVERRDDRCPSLFTFRALCANLPQDGLESRSKVSPQLWPTLCLFFGRSTRAFEIGLQRSKDKCESISIFSLETKMSDTQAGYRVLSPPARRFQSYLQSVVADDQQSRN